VTAVAQLGDIPRVERLFEKMAAAKVEANASMYNALISACAKKGDVDRAESWLNMMLKVGSAADVASYSAVIHACAKASDTPRAEGWVEKMEAAGIEANIVTYNSMINACARCGDVERAEFWLKRLTERGLIPGQFTFNSMLNACAKSGDLNRCKHWLAVMRSHGCNPDGVSYGTVIHACVLKPDLDTAENLLKEMVESGEVKGESSSFCYSLVVQALARGGEVNRSGKWLLSALSRAVEVTSPMFSSVVVANVKAGQLEEAEHWLHRMHVAGHPLPKTGCGAPDAIAIGWMKQGQPARAAAMRRLAPGKAAGPTIFHGPGRAGRG